MRTSDKIILVSESGFDIHELVKLLKDNGYDTELFNGEPSFLKVDSKKIGVNDGKEKN